MNIACLPREVLLLVLANLRTQDIRSLALTFNKNMIAVCIKFLQPLCVQIRNEKDMAHRFRFQGFSKTDFVDVEALQRHKEGHNGVWWIDTWDQHREGLRGLWDQYIDTWDLLESDDADLPRLPAEFSCVSESQIVCTLGPVVPTAFVPGNTRSVTRHRRTAKPLTSDRIQTFATKAAFLDVIIPPSFWKAVSDVETVRGMTLAGDSYIEVKSFELCHTQITKPHVGYLLPFMHDPDRRECSWYLYLEPGPDYRCCVLRIFDVLKTTNVDDELMWNILVNAITTEDRRIAKERDLRLCLMDSTEIGIAGFCFKDWLAHRLFNQWLEAEPNIVDALAKTQKIAGPGKAGIKDIQQYASPPTVADIIEPEKVQQPTDPPTIADIIEPEKVQESTDSRRKRRSGWLRRVLHR